MVQPKFRPVTYLPNMQILGTTRFFVELQNEQH